MFLSLAILSSQMYRKLEGTAKKLELQKEVLKRTNIAFGRFVPRELLGFLGMDTVVEVCLDDQVQKNMTILFSDIRNCTQITEPMTPKESFNLLNSYLGQMGPIIRNQGDIMALFPESPAKAVEAALAMRQLLGDYNAGRERAGYFPLDMGIIKVKGKENGLALYEIFDPNDPLFGAKSEHLALFEAAVRGLEGLDPASSAALFHTYRDKVPGDTCLEQFLARLRTS